jgi:hypothetical protein
MRTVATTKDGGTVKTLYATKVEDSRLKEFAQR